MFSLVAFFFLFSWKKTLIGGMGELHLEYLLDRLEKHYKVKVRDGKHVRARRSHVLFSKGVVGSIMIAYRCAPSEMSDLTLNMSHS